MRSKSCQRGFALVELSSMSNEKRTAFTLVELLVVIGIIAVLISMLLPALNRARQQAVSTQCLSDLKQIGNAYLMYANENQGWLPPGASADYDFTAGTSNQTPERFAQWGVPGTTLEVRFGVTLAMAKYLGVPNPQFKVASQNPVAVPVMYCPADNQTVDNLAVDPTWLLTNDNGTIAQSRFKYYYWGNPYGTISAMTDDGGADAATSQLFVNTLLNPPAIGGNTSAGIEYVCKTSDKNAASICICSCRTKQQSNSLGTAFSMHGSPTHGWTNELFGDFHAESRQHNQLTWRWGKTEAAGIFY